ncbi:MAG TPA: ABC transporter ATP-binding protein [Syntrophomonadaceae bacterium]|nr:ABC transporter ATP-binding protein [Syntrophomonadaceae bacterium]
MLKLAKYLKPFIFSLVLAIMLLFGQAFSELNLPNYMSNIVNVGIQQNGIKKAAPDAISLDGIKLMTTFMDDGEKELISENYIIVSSRDSNEAGKAYSSIYPKVDNEFYVKKDVDKNVSYNLDETFGAAAVKLVYVLQEMAQQNGTKDTLGLPTSKNIDLLNLYLAQPQLVMLFDSTDPNIYENLLLNDDNLKQTGIMFTRAFYNELGVDISKSQTNYILKIGLIMLTIALLGGIASILVSLLSSRIAAGVARNLRQAVFEKIESFSSNEFDNFSTASLITRCTNDVSQIQRLLMMGIRLICYAPIMAIGAIFMAVKKSASMSWIIALACIVLICLVIVILSIVMPKFRAIQKLVDQLNLVSRENLSGIMVVRSFVTQEYEKKRFELTNDDLTKTTLFVNRIMAFMMPMMMLIMNGVSLIIVWVGAKHIASSTMQVGDMMAFMQYAIQVIMSFLMISMIFILVPRAQVSATRIAEVLETKISILDPEEPKQFHLDKKGLVEFRHVYFRYNGAKEDALKDINFTAKPRETTAIIGSTGSGKSTIANLLLRFYDISQGQILVEGVEVQEVKQKDLRSKIGYVPQKGVLHSGTILSNIRYGNQEASDSEIRNVAAVAQAIEFIVEKPEGFHSTISQGGINVSGGQKQRLSIARALAKKPEILIFDDSFSALDYKTDIALRQALKEHTGDSTLIIVAQRVSTIMHAEQIIVLDKGEIVGSGTHRELLRTCPEYYEIASSQLSQEELA